MQREELSFHWSVRRTCSERRPCGCKLVADLAGAPGLTLKVYDCLYHEIFNGPEQKEVLNDLVEWPRSHVTDA